MPIAKTIRPMINGTRFEPGRLFSCRPQRESSHQQGGAHHLVEKAGPESRNRWKSRKYPRRIIQLRIHQDPLGVIVDKEKQRSRKRSRKLSKGYNAAPSPGKSFRGGQSDRHRRVKMRSTDRASDVDAEGNRESHRKTMLVYPPLTTSPGMGGELPKSTTMATNPRPKRIRTMVPKNSAMNS